MNNDLYRLIYLSHNEICGDGNTIREEIEQILATSRQNNRAANITGALMFNNNCFAQVLEGTHHQIQLTFERIQCDPRHSNVAILDFDLTPARRFNEWSMAYVGENSDTRQAFEQIQKTSAFDPHQLMGERIYDLLRTHLHAAENHNL